MLKWLWLSGLVIMLDQATKLAADRLLTFHSPVTVIPNFFNFTLAYNEGAAFSFLSDVGGWQRWFFTVLAVVVSVVLIFWIKNLSRQERWTAAALSLILGGAIGNVIDRVLYGHVIDFIQWYYHSFYWPSFNIADSAISVGAAILIFQTLFGHKPESTTNTQSDH
ncbi:MAG: signal peptidase II [Thiothrix sp.]|nr:MAG: signal peptidase II [Thiothrix sp.]